MGRPDAPMQVGPGRRRRRRTVVRVGPGQKLRFNKWFEPIGLQVQTGHGKPFFAYSSHFRLLGNYIYCIILYIYIYIINNQKYSYTNKNTDGKQIPLVSTSNRTRPSLSLFRFGHFGRYSCTMYSFVKPFGTRDRCGRVAVLGRSSKRWSSSRTVRRCSWRCRCPVTRWGPQWGRERGDPRGGRVRWFRAGLPRPWVEKKEAESMELNLHIGSGCGLVFGGERGMFGRVNCRTHLDEEA